MWTKVAECKTAVYPSLTNLRYCSISLNLRYYYGFYFLLVRHRRDKHTVSMSCSTYTHTQTYTHIYIYIKWTVFVNVTTKSAQHAHARMIVIIVEKSPNSSHIYDHGFMDNTNRQAVKNWLDSQKRDASLTSWRQPLCIKWLPPRRKGRISFLWIKSVFDCLTIGIIHETMVVYMTWVWTFFNNYIYIYTILAAIDNKIKLEQNTPQLQNLMYFRADSRLASSQWETS